MEYLVFPLCLLLPLCSDQMIPEPLCLVYLLLFYSSLWRKQWEMFVTRPLIVYSVLKLLHLHCGGRRVSGPRQHACPPPSCFQGRVVLGALPLPVRQDTFPSSRRRGALTAWLALWLLDVFCPYFCLPKRGLGGLMRVFNGAGLLVLSDSRNPHRSTSRKCKKARNFHL